MAKDRMHFVRVRGARQLISWVGIVISIAGCGGTIDARSRPDGGAGDGATGGPGPGTSPCSSAGAGPVRLATARKPIAIALDAANVYWVDSDAGTVNEVSVCGGATKTLVTTSALGSSTLIPAGIAVQGSDVYFTTQDPWNPNEDDGAVWKVPAAGGTPAMLAHHLDHPGPIAVTGASMVWIDPWVTYSNDGRIRRAALDGSSPSILASAQNGPLSLALGGGEVVWTTSGSFDSVGGAIYETQMGGGIVEGIGVGQGMPAGVAVQGADVFWADYDPKVNDSGRVLKKPLDPNAAAHPTTLASGGVPQGIAVDASHVYWTDSQSQSVQRVPIAGGAPTTLATKQVGPLVMTIDDTNVYWTTMAVGTGQGSIMKLAK